MSGILYVMAVDQEYGPALRARILPLLTGVGPVEAAVVLTRHLAECNLRNALPKLVVSLGSAGSRTLQQVGVFQASSVSYRDMDATALGFDAGITPFLGLPAALDLVPQVPGLPSATLATGASIVSGAAYDRIAAEMVDMETYSVLRACQQFGLPLIAIRGISDGTAELRQLTDWTQYLHLIDEKLAAVVDQIESAYRNGALL